MLIRCNDKAISVYMKFGSLPEIRVHYVRFDMIKSIYLTEDEYGLTLEIFLFSKKRICLSNSLDRTAFYIKNWDGLISALFNICPNFNMNNYALFGSFKPYVLYNIPVICWQSETKVTDLTVIETQGGPLVVWKETGVEYMLSNYFGLLENSKLLEKLAFFLRRSRSKFRECFFAEIVDEAILVYSKRMDFSRKVVHKINFDSLKAIFADIGCVQQEENKSWEPPHMHLKLLLNGDEIIDLRQSICEDDILSIINWDELIKGIIKKLPSFNMSNYELAYKAYSPILCWHAEKQVPNLKITITQNRLLLLHEDSGKEYWPDVYTDRLRRTR